MYVAVDDFVNMNSLVGRATGLAPYISATVNVIPPSTRPIITEFARRTEKLVSEPRPLITTSYGLSKAFIPTGGWLNTRATVGLTCVLFETFEPSLFIIKLNLGKRAFMMKNCLGRLVYCLFVMFTLRCD